MPSRAPPTNGRVRTRRPPANSNAAIRKVFCPPTTLKDAAGLASITLMVIAFGAGLPVPSQSAHASKAAVTN